MQKRHDTARKCRAQKGVIRWGSTVGRKPSIERVFLMRTPEQNIAGVMEYQKHIEPQREQFEKVTRYDIEAIQARLDYLEGHIAELEARLDELL